MSDRADSTRRALPVRGIFGMAMLAFVVWYLFFAGTSGDNDVAGGLSDLASGLAELPELASDGQAYGNLWNFMFDQEGLGEILGHTVDHAQLVLASMFWAVLLSVGLGILAHRVPKLRGPIVSISSILLTIPSLALFAVFISISFIGIGDRGPLIALTLYSILPILRNTVTGLEEVDRAVVESAKGMGLSAFQRLTRIELPLAWPVILTGIRVAALLNVGIAAIAKLVGGTGLGVYINDGLTRYPNVGSVERMWTGVIWTIVLALLFDLAFTLLRRFTTPTGLR